jgi:hypothetical protein
MALLTALGAFVVPSAAAEPVKASEMSPLSKTQCSANTMCVWENNNFTGTFSWWDESNTGCHNHANNPKLRSGWNRTNFRVRIGGTGVYLLPGETFVVLEGSNPVTGEICFPA